MSSIPKNTCKGDPASEKREYSKEHSKFTSLCTFIILSLGLILGTIGVEARDLKEVHGADLPEIRITNPEAPCKPLAVKIPESHPDWPRGPHAERPLWVVRLNDDTKLCFIGTNHVIAYKIRPGHSILSDSNALDLNSGHLVSRGLVPRGPVEWPSPESVMEDPRYWQHHYYGASTVHLIDHPKTGKPCLVTFLHGENSDFPNLERQLRWRNENFQGKELKWTFYPCSILPLPFSEDQPQNRKSYFAFVGMAWSPVDESGKVDFMKHDLGPVVWPVKPYLDSDDHYLSTGVRHPYGFVHEGYIYVYYKFEEDITGGANADGAIRVARASLDSLFEPGAFKVYHDGAFNEPALPVGFEKTDRRYLKRAGGQADPILPGNPNSHRFQVAKLKGTPYFLGVEHRVYYEEDREFYEVWLHLSGDLVHWSRGTPVPGTAGSKYNSRLGHRPILVNKDYTGHELVDPDGFYIAAKRGAKGTFVRFTSIELIDR
jgi:hypothetical protein